MDFHADDYGISVNNCHRILELVKNGRLDSFSIIPNMSCYEECISILKAEWASLPVKPLISVHINLIDGMSLSGKCKPFGSWGKLFAQNFLFGIKRKKLEGCISEEIKAQIRRINSDIGDLPGIDGKLRLDSHVHTHIIPVVFDAMLKAVRDMGEMDHVDFVRISSEPLLMFLTTPGIVFTFPAVNLVKNILLRILGIRGERILEQLGIKHGRMWGLCMSGRMDADRIERLMPKMKKYAKRKNLWIEVLGHPGIVLPDEALSEYGAQDREFFISENRNVEYEGFVKCGGHNREI